jgi:hypothetical protein
VNLRGPSRVLAAVAVAALTMTGCSENGEPGAVASASSSPSPSTTVSIPADASLTEQGTELSFGSTGTVLFEPDQNRGTVLDLTVKSAREGSLDDFKGFILDDPYKKNANYFYVDVTVENVGEGDVGGVPVPLWGVNAENTLLPAVNFTTKFPSCPSQQLPDTFGASDTFETYLVFLSPDHGTLEALSYRPSQEFNPITWTGEIQPPAKPEKDKKGKSGKG